jgi:long-chain fatty acid transport protein
VGLPAQAEWIQTVGVGERAILLGGAFTARADDYTAYFYNPAGAAEFRGPVVGLNTRVLDTTNLKIRDRTGSHDVEGTTVDSPVAIAPTLGAYLPLSVVPWARQQIPYADRVTVGVGLGAPWALAADWENEAGVHRFAAMNEQLFVVDLVPTFAFRVNDQLSVGAGVNWVAFQHARVEPLIGDGFIGEAANFVTGGAVPPNLTIDGVPDGSLLLLTNGGHNLVIPPNDFDPDWRTVSYTLGALYRVNDRLRIGATYREEMPTTFTGKAHLFIASSATLGVLPQRTLNDFELDLHMPRNLQWGVAYDVIPKVLTCSLDLLWTNWGGAKGFNRATRVRLVPGLIELPPALAPLLRPANPGANASVGDSIRNLLVDYEAKDTISVRAGVEYRVIPDLRVLVGYAYDPAFHDAEATDLLTYSSNRHLASLGFQYELTRLLAPWLGSRNAITLASGFQAIVYEDRVLREGRGKNLGGVAYYQDQDGSFLTLNFVPNTDPFAGFRSDGQPITGPLNLGGFIWAAGLSVEYRFLL